MSEGRESIPSDWWLAQPDPVAMFPSYPKSLSHSQPMQPLPEQ
jgi:hypothetical protein